MEPELQKTAGRFYEIDLLRFVAAASVLLYHYTYRGYGAGNFSPVPFTTIGQVSRYGYLGVELFFIISGYVVLLSAQGKTVRQFFVSRITRLYPAFWVACTLTFIVERIWGTKATDPLMPYELQAGIKQYVYNMTMLHDFLGVTALDGTYWSLTVEITFYFLVSLLIAYKLMRHIDQFILNWLLYTAVSGFYGTNGAFVYLFIPQYAPFFAAGMLFYLLQNPVNRTYLRYGLLAASYLLAVRSGIKLAIEQSDIFHAEISRNITGSIITIFFGVFYLITFKKIDFSKQYWLAWLGAITYPLYLIHSNIGFILFTRLEHYANKYILLGFIITLLVGCACSIHMFVEKRLSKLFGKQVNKALNYVQALAER